jgi:RimJ/RimL family protein N-acetyltransferase
MCLKLCKPRKAKIKDGRTILIRRPRMADAKKIKDYFNSLVDEDAPIAVNEKITLKEERSKLDEILKNIRMGKSHVLIAELNKKIVSTFSLTKERGRMSHVAGIGMGVDKDYRRLGIASIMMNRILEIGKKDKSIKVIYLETYEFNHNAQKLCRKFGFKKVAKLKNRIRIGGKLGDIFVMDYKG